MALSRWTAPVVLMLLTTACHAAPMPNTARAQAGVLQAAGKPSAPYEKYFPVPAKPQRFPVAVIAHRGFSKVAPENTLSAFKAAIDAEADVLELDVHRTKDGQVIVMHDNDVNRTTNGEGEIGDMTLGQLKQLDAGGWFSPAFQGERVPTLDEVLSLAKGRANVMIEIKDKTPDLPRLVHQSIERFQMRQEVFVSSFYQAPIGAMRSLVPNLAIGALITPLQNPSKRAQHVKASMAQAHHKSIDAQDVKTAHAAGLRVHVWTVNAPADMARLAMVGVDGIITDDVATCQQVLLDVFSRPYGPEPLPAPVDPQPAPVEPQPDPVDPEPVPDPSLGT